MSVKTVADVRDAISALLGVTPADVVVSDRDLFPLPAHEQPATCTLTVSGVDLEVVKQQLCLTANNGNNGNNNNKNNNNNNNNNNEVALVNALWEHIENASTIGDESTTTNTDTAVISMPVVIGVLFIRIFYDSTVTPDEAREIFGNYGLGAIELRGALVHAFKIHHDTYFAEVNNYVAELFKNVSTSKKPLGPLCDHLNDARVRQPNAYNIAASGRVNVNNTATPLTTIEEMANALQPYTPPCVKFTHHHECGMRAREYELQVALSILKLGFGDGIKEVKHPLGIVSAPRQGKSLFLDVLAEKAQEALGNETVVTIKVTMNGDTILPQRLKFASEAAALLWFKLFGRELSGVKDGRTARELLEKLLPGKYIIVYVDELTVLTDHLPKEEHQSLAALLLSLYSERTMLVFSGFDFHINSAFRSSSGRQPFTIVLPPIFTSDEDAFAQLLPLKNALLCVRDHWKKEYINHPRLREYDMLHLYYEVAKTSPGVLGALLEKAVNCQVDPNNALYRHIPLLNPKSEAVPKVFELMEQYSICCVTTDNFPVCTSELGGKLLENKIGVAMAPNNTGTGNSELVYIIPAVAFFLCKTCINCVKESSLWQWGQVIVMLLEHWVKAAAKANGNILEQFVFACLSFKCVAKGWPLPAPPRDDLLSFKNPTWLKRYENKYPLEPLPPNTPAANSVMMTQDSLFGIDLVVRETLQDGIHETLIQIKGGKVVPDSVIKQLARPIDQILPQQENDATPCIKVMMQNMKAAGVTHASYVLLGTLPSSASEEKMHNALDTSLGGNELPLPLTVKALRLGSREADLFLTPLFASTMPNLFAKDDANVENIYNPNVEPDGLWCAVKEKATGVDSLRQLCTTTAAAAVSKFDESMK